MTQLCVDYFEELFIYDLQSSNIFIYYLYLLIAVSCVNIPYGAEPSVDNICRGLNADQQLITLFSENYVPVNCRSSLEGVWQFAYQV